LGIVAIACIVAACGAVAPSSTAPGQRRAPVAAIPLQLKTILTLTQTATNIAYDAGRNVIWLAETGFGAPGYLHRIDPSTGAEKSFKLPTEQFAGPDSQIKVDASGDVWMSNGYVLMRLQLGSQAVASVTIATGDPDALEQALDPTLGGTWVTAIGIAGDDVLIARRNVAALQRFDSSFRQTSRYGLPASFAGSTDIYVEQSGQIEVLAGAAVGKVLGVFTSDGKMVQSIDVQGNRLAASGDMMVVSGGIDNGAVITWTPTGLVADTSLTIGTYGSLAVPDPTGGIVLYDRRSGQIVHVQNGSVTTTYSLPTSEVSLPGPPGVRPFSAPLQITNLVVDSQGDLWLVGGGKELLEAPATA